MAVHIIFLFGAVGALAPEVIRLYNLRQGGAGAFPPFYFLISLAFAALGGLVATILPTTTALAAFYAGISTPVLVNTALRQALQPRGQLKAAAAKPQPSPLQRFVGAL